MEKVLHIQKLLLRSRRLPLVVMALTLVILAAAITLSTVETRRRIREQISGRDGRMFHELARMHQAADAELGDLLNDPADPAGQFTILFEISRLKSVVMAARLFDAQGRFVEAVPADVTETNLPLADLQTLQRLEPLSHFRPAARLADQFLSAPQDSGARPMSLLVVNVPLHDTAGRRLHGIAQFILDGQSIAAEFARLDQNLVRQAAAALVVGAGILVLAIGWAFRRLNQAHQLLAERTEHLVKANQELALAAKTSAVGAVTSHLIHGLKNPLAGLQNFVAGLGSAVADNPDTDLGQAIAATRRMQSMINEVLGVLRDEEGAGHYEVPLSELLDIISSKVQPLCREHGVELQSALDTQAMLPSRAANLVALVLVNLVQNAIEATPRGGTVRLSLTDTGDGLACAVRDQGPGFSEERNVFAPCRSAKDGGSGIGLAISKQLANHLGAGLELKGNTPQGCVFVLTLPSSLWKGKTSSVTVTLA